MFTTQLAIANKELRTAEYAYTTNTTPTTTTALLRAQRRVCAIRSQLLRRAYTTPIANEKRARQLIRRVGFNRHLGLYTSDYEFNQAYDRAHRQWSTHHNKAELYRDQCITAIDPEWIEEGRLHTAIRDQLGLRTYKHTLPLTTFNTLTLEWE